MLCIRGVKQIVMYNIMIAFLLALFACANNVHDKTKTMNQQHMPADSSSQNKIRVKVNSYFTIQLKCNAGTGYSWQLSDSSFKEAIQYLKQDFKNLTPDKDGGDGMQIFHFKGLQKGTHAVRFIYVQPFKKPWPSNAPVKTFFVDIY